MRSKHSSKPPANKPMHLADELCLFWHGQVDGKQQPFHLYTREAREGLRQEVEGAIEHYARADDLTSADRLMRYWELISLYIATQNEETQERSLGKGPASFCLSQFLELLYAKQPPSAFWRAFSKHHHLRALPRSSFWDQFEDFQPHRLDVVDWLCAHAKERILDLGSGAHSYLMVDTAVDGSKIALARNEWAKKRVAADLDGDFTRRVPSRSFDTILLNSILAYVRSPQTLLRKCGKLLRGDGLLLITNSPVQKHHPARIFVKREVETKELKTWLKSAGFDVVADDSTHSQVRIAARLKK